MARLTKRERECKKITKAKARKKRRQTLIRRTVLIGGFTTILMLSGWGWWLVSSGAAERVVNKTTADFYGMTADAGFKIRNVYLEGRRHTPMDKIQQALDLSIGDPIFSSSVEELSDRLEMLGPIRRARVERVLPDTLHIHIAEREPAFIWQNNKHLTLLDADGMLMGDFDLAHYTKLPVIVGEDAPALAPELAGLMATEPQLFKHVRSAIRVGERRWNIRFNNGMEVRLPESDPQVAWHRLADMERNENILSRAVTSVDLRLPGRVFIQFAPAGAPQADISAKDT